jgi:hypothetical protein
MQQQEKVNEIRSAQIGLLKPVMSSGHFRMNINRNGRDDHKYDQ